MVFSFLGDRSRTPPLIRGPFATLVPLQVNEDGHRCLHTKFLSPPLGAGDRGKPRHSADSRCDDEPGVKTNTTGEDCCTASNEPSKIRRLARERVPIDLLPVL